MCVCKRFFLLYKCAYIQNKYSHTKNTRSLQRLKQILHNILGNAAKFTTKGLIDLTVEIDKQQSLVYFIVTDTGPGIAADKLDSVFRPYNTVRLYVCLCIYVYVYVRDAVRRKRRCSFICMYGHIRVFNVCAYECMMHVHIYDQTSCIFCAFLWLLCMLLTRGCLHTNKAR